MPNKRKTVEFRFGGDEASSWDRFKAGYDETIPAKLEEMQGHYKRSKFLGEQVALESARQGFPVVIVNPTAPIGDSSNRAASTAFVAGIVVPSTIYSAAGTPLRPQRVPLRHQRPRRWPWLTPGCGYRHRRGDPRRSRGRRSGARAARPEPHRAR